MSHTSAFGEDEASDMQIPRAQQFQAGLVTLRPKIHFGRGLYDSILFRPQNSGLASYTNVCVHVWCMCVQAYIYVCVCTCACLDL